VKGTTYRTLVAERSKLQRRMEQAWQEERQGVLQRIRELMTHWDIRSNELRRYRRGTYHTKPVVPKYRDPETGKTWSGRGRIPGWIAGKDRNAFLIEQDELDSCADDSELRRW
jgi:DNA-binding protein H-NS